MGRFLRQAFILGGLLITTTIYLNGTRIFTPPSANSTYLSNLSYTADNPWQTMIFGGRDRWQSYDTYNHLMGEYDEKRAYGLLNQNDEMDYMRRFSALADSALHDLESFHTRAYGKKFANQISDELNIRALVKSRSPLLILGAAAALYTGRVVRYRLSPEIALETRTSMNQSRFGNQYFGWNHAGLGTSFGSSVGNAGASFSFSKQLAPGVAVTYDKGTDQSVGVSYSQGF